MAYRVGDVVNGKRLGVDNEWHPVDPAAAGQPAAPTVTDGRLADGVPPSGAPEDVPPASLPADEKPWYARWWVAVLLALALVLVVLLVLSTRGGEQSVNTTSSGDQPSAAASPEAEPPAASTAPAAPAPAVSSAPAPTAAPAESRPATPAAPPAAAVPAPAVPPAGPGVAGLNAPVRDGAFEFTVTRVTCGQPQVGSQFLSKTAQGQFCLVSLTVANVGDKPQVFDGANQKAVDSSGRKLPADTEAAWYIEESKSFLEPLNPGSKAQGNIVFDIPKNSTIAALELHESASSKGATVKAS